MKEPAVNTSLMQRMNRLKVLRYIKENPGCARCTVSEATGLSLGAVTNLTGFLLKEELISESGYVSEDRVGRKRIKLNFNADAHRIICVFIKEKTLGVYLTDLSGKKIKSVLRDIDGGKIEEIINEICSVIASFNEKITAIGVSLSALVLDKGKRVVSSSLHFDNLNIKRLMEDNLGYPVFVDNISISKALGYIKSNPELKKSRIVFADMEEGFGGVYINKGEVIRDIPCEIGHTTVEINGKPCVCGNKGCLEVMLSKEKDISKRTEYTGVGLASLVNIFAPTTLISNGNHNIDEDKTLEVINKRAYPALLEKLETRFVNTDEKMIVEGIADSLWDFIFNIGFENPIV